MNRWCSVKDKTRLTNKDPKPHPKAMKSTSLSNAIITEQTRKQTKRREIIHAKKPLFFLAHIINTAIIDTDDYNCV